MTEKNAGEIISDAEREIRDLIVKKTEELAKNHGLCVDSVDVDLVISGTLFGGLSSHVGRVSVLTRPCRG